MNKKRIGKRLFAALLCLATVLCVAPIIGAGAVCDHGSHSDFITVSADGTIPDKGSAVLNANVVLDETVVVSGDLHLCLNGHNITGSADPFFYVEAGTRLTICDCTGEGTISTASGTALNNGFVNVNGSKFILNGGTLTGNETQGYYGGAVQLIDATFVMNGGTITENTTQYYGGAISMIGASAFMMNDGTISDNSAGNGGAIGGSDFDGKIVINGGTISGNYASEYGGAIYCDGGDVKVAGGRFANNTSVGDGGAIFMAEAVKDDGELKVLALGNETTRDTLYYLGALGVATETHITVGYLHHDEAVLRNHDNLMETNGTYQFYKTDADGVFQDQGASTIPNALDSDSWDVIVLQNGILHAGVRTTFNSDLEYMVDYMEDKAPNAKLYWNMTWALQDAAEFSSMGVSFNGENNGYNGSQALMYNNVVECLEDYITGKNAPYNSTNIENYGARFGWGFNGYLYTGAAIQYLRQQTGDEPTRDGVYLSGVTGRLTAAVAALKALAPSADLDALIGNATLIETVNAMKDDAVAGISGEGDLTAATLQSVVSAVKAAGADAADGTIAKVTVPASATKEQSPEAQLTVGREDGPTRLRFANVQRVGDNIIVTAQRSIGHNAIAVGEEGSLHYGGGEMVIWSGKENYTSAQWQQSYENPLLVLDGYQMHEWGVVPGDGTIYDRYAAAKEGRTGYMLTTTGDTNMNLAHIDMTGDRVEDEVLLLTFCSNYYKNNGNMTFQDARATWLTYSLDGGETWAKPQWLDVDNTGSIQGHMKHGDIAVFDDGNILVPFYYGSGITTLACEYKFDTAAKKWVQIGASRPITRPEDAYEEAPGNDGWNEPAVVSPDGGDTVYAMARRTGHVLVSYDRGKSWMTAANEPGLVAQPRFTVLADDLVLASWQITTGGRRGGVSKLFYTGAGWTNTPVVDVYVTDDVNGDLGDQGTTLLSDGKIFAVNYDVKYNAIVGNIVDPLGEDFDQFKPIEVGQDAGEDVVTLYSADSVELPYTTTSKVTGSHTVSANVTFTSADGAAIINVNAGTVTVPYDSNLTLNQPAKVTVSVVGKYMYTRVTQGSYDSGWDSSHGNGKGTKTGISGSGITVANVAVTRQTSIELDQTMTAVVGDEAKQLNFSILPARGGYTFTSSNTKVVTVDRNGIVTFVGAGSADITLTIDGYQKTCNVTVHAVSAEISGTGTIQTILDDNFDSYTVGAKLYNANSSDYSFKHDDWQNTVIAGDASNKYLEMSTNKAWFANKTAITGDYTVQFDVKFAGHNLLYLNMWQKSATNEGSNTVKSITYLMSWGLKHYYTNSEGEKIAVPAGTTSSAIAYGNGCVTELAGTNTWMRVKMVRTEGSLYIKTWNRTQEEPSAWTFKLSDAALTVDEAAHFCIYGNGSGVYYLDNLKITKRNG